MATEVEQFCQSRFPDTYAGLELLHGQHEVVVYRKPSPALDDDLRSRFPGTRFVFRDARHSQMELRLLTAQIAQDIPYWRSRGVQISVVGPLTDGSAVEVGTPQPTTARAALVARYGADRLRVKQLSAVGGPLSRGSIPSGIPGHLDPSP